MILNNDFRKRGFNRVTAESAPTRHLCLLH